MSFRFEMSDVSDSFTKLYHYVGEIADEKAWKGDPILSDSPAGTWAKFPHPNTAAKDVKANSEPFSNIDIHMMKPYAPQLGCGISYTSKKASARFHDMLQDRNRNICDKFFAMAHSLDGFSFKIQVKTSFKNRSSAKYEDVFIAPSGSVSFDDVVQNMKKVLDICSTAEMSEDGKAVKYRGPGISLCRDFSIDDLALENSSFDNAIKSLHEFMLSEPGILSAKDVEKFARERMKVIGKNKFNTILSNRADQQFYCRLSNAEFERVPDNIGVQVWDIESFQEKKYIRAALKLVREI